jgi:hypothetical protein
MKALAIAVLAAWTAFALGTLLSIVVALVATR